MGASISKNRNSSQKNILEKDLIIFILNKRNTNISVLHCFVPIKDINNNSKRIMSVKKDETTIIHMISNITNHIYIYDRIIDDERILQKIKEAQNLKDKTIINVY